MYYAGRNTLFAFTKDDNAPARQMFEKAIELDPRYAMAYALFGLNYWFGWGMGFEDPSALKRGLRAEQQAIALDDLLPLAHSTLAEFHFYGGQTELALAEAQRGIALDPNSASGYMSLSHILNELGKATQALAEIENAIRLDPRNAINYLIDRGWSYTQLRRWDEAISSLKAFQTLTRITFGPMFS